MTLSINVGAVHGNAANNRERENESPHVSRKSPRLSTSSSPSSHRGGPLSDVHSKISNSPRREESSKSSSSSSSTPSKPKPPTPARSSALPPTYNNNRFNSSANKFKPRGPSKDDIEATDDKQASVNQLSHWLSESAKKNRKPPIHHRQTAGGGSSHHITTPIRFATKPRINKADVEATDDKRVSVKTLSSWMSDDPFQQKKVRTIRSGSKVIAKSRIFEKDQNVKISDCNIKTGSVEERQAWLSEAFSHESDVVKPQILSEKKARTFKPKKKTASPEMELKSVSEKKEWLSKAFKNNTDGDSPATVHQTKSFDVNQEEDEIPDIHHTKSFEVHDVYPTKSFEASLKDARKSIMTPWVNQAKSFEGVHDVYPTKSFGAQIQDTKESIMKPSSVDDGKGTMSHHPIKHAKSYDGGMKSKKSHVTNSFEKQQSVVRLYQMDKNDTESPEKTLKSVHDKQAWLSNAFKKPAGANDVSGHAASSTVVKDAKKSKSNDVDHVNVNVGEVSTVTNVGKSVNDEKSVSTTKINDNSSDKPDIDSMTVAERARWLKGAFK